MTVPAPHFHLYSEAHTASACRATAASAAHDGSTSGKHSVGQWRFVLRHPTGETSLEVADHEEGATEERLELLAVVRGLEALDQPSRVTLVTARRNVQYGLEGGIAQWRENEWQWERFGQMTPVKNRDLWQRIDRLLEIHTVNCRPRGKSAASDLSSPPPRGAGLRSAQQRTRGGRTLRIDFPSASRSEPPPTHAHAPGLLAALGRFASGLLRRYRAT